LCFSGEFAPLKRSPVKRWSEASPFFGLFAGSGQSSGANTSAKKQHLPTLAKDGSDRIRAFIRRYFSLSRRALGRNKITRMA
jgi:hypothetical protein